MDKQQYIQLRLTDDHAMIMWRYATEHGLAKGPKEFSTYFMVYTQRMGAVYINSIIERVINYYDIKFGITYITYTPKIKKFNPTNLKIEEIVGEKIIIDIY